MRPAARGVAACCVLVLLATASACDAFQEPDAPDLIAAYLLDRVDGDPPPAPVCEQDAIDQVLRFESFALDDDGRYGRSQEIQLDDDPPVLQEERGDYEDQDSVFVLVNAESDTIRLVALDEDREFVRRIHTCGDTLRYRFTPVLDND